MAGNVRYEISRADYAAAMLLSISPTKRRVILIVGVLAVGILVAMIAEHLDDWPLRNLSRITIIMSLFFLIIPYVGWLFHAVFMARREFKQFSKLSGPTDLQWDDNGFRLSLPKGGISYEWQDLVRFKESRQVFLLYPQQRLFHVVPKSAFDRTAALDDFKAGLINERTRKA